MTIDALQVSCVQMHWAKKLETNLEKTLCYINLAAEAGSHIVVFPEANLTSYYFPYATSLDLSTVKDAIIHVCNAARKFGIWVIIGSIQKTSDRFLNLAHIIDDNGIIVHEYAKVHLAGKDERSYCRAGEKLSIFDIHGIPSTLVICRDGRHPELYRIPAMAGARILFHPSCSSDDVKAVHWKRVSGRAQQAVGPNTKIFHCVANAVGTSPDGKQLSAGSSFIRHPSGLALVEASLYQEEMITATLDIGEADRSYILDSIEKPPFLKDFWHEMIREALARKDTTPQ